MDQLPDVTVRLEERNRNLLDQRIGERRLPHGPAQRLITSGTFLGGKRGQIAVECGVDFLTQRGFLRIAEKFLLAEPFEQRAGPFSKRQECLG